MAPSRVSVRIVEQITGSEHAADDQSLGFEPLDRLIASVT